MCVEGCMKDEHVVATVHGDHITIGGERSAVEFLINMISRTYEIKNQVIGEDAGLEESKNLVSCHQVGITIESDEGGGSIEGS